MLVADTKDDKSELALQAQVLECGKAVRNSDLGAKGVLVYLPTGGGKTRVALEIALAEVERGGAVSTYCHQWLRETIRLKIYSVSLPYLLCPHPIRCSSW